MALSPNTVCNMRWEIAIAMIGPLRMTAGAFFQDKAEVLRFFDLDLERS